MSIKIRPSPTADTRTCDWSKVTKATLLNSSLQHIADIHAGLEFFKAALDKAAALHDHDKITGLDHFHADFQTGFKETGWWDNHRKVNRHHLTEADGIPPDVNLIDVLDFITDCTMAGMARSGSVRPLTLPTGLLERAFQNTAALLLANVELVRDEPAPTGEHPVDAMIRTHVPNPSIPNGQAIMVGQIPAPKEPTRGEACQECEGVGLFRGQGYALTCAVCGGTGKAKEGGR